jgi:hypothetical protein
LSWFNFIANPSRDQLLESFYSPFYKKTQTGSSNFSSLPQAARTAVDLPL